MQHKKASYYSADGLLMFQRCPLLSNAQRKLLPVEVLKMNICLKWWLCVQAHMNGVLQ